MSLSWYFNGHTYEIVTNAMTYDEASTFAESYGAHLATISSSTENDLILSNALDSLDLNSTPYAPDGGNSVYLWLGASDSITEGNWKWVDGSGVNSGYTNWGDGALGSEPDNYNNQDALAYGLENWPYGSNSGQGYGDAGEWNDIDTGNLIFSIIEWDHLEGTQGDDRLVGDASSNILYGRSGNDVLIGKAGKDFLYGGSGLDNMKGGTGNDTYFVDRIGDVVVESVDSGFDTVKSSSSFSLPSNVEKLILTGTAGIDGTGNGAANTINGNSAANVLNGGGGNDQLNGIGGSDTLNGGNGADTLKGGAGNDILKGEGGKDILRGGGGNDSLNGGALKDKLYGDTGSDKLNGNAGNDILRGAGGKDTLNGGLGNDTLDGGALNDLMTGGAGRDKFVFSIGHDTVTDFEDELDLIQIKVLFTDVVISDAGDDALVSIGDDSMTLENFDHTLLTEADFIIV